MKSGVDCSRTEQHQSLSALAVARNDGRLDVVIAGIQVLRDPAPRRSELGQVGQGVRPRGDAVLRLAQLWGQGS